MLGEPGWGAGMATVCDLADSLACRVLAVCYDMTTTARTGQLKNRISEGESESPGEGLGAPGRAESGRKSWEMQFKRRGIDDEW